MNGKVFSLLCFAAGIIVVLLMAIVHFHVMPPAHADAVGGVGAQSFAASSGIFERENEGCVWIVDPEKKRLACYQNDRGVGIKFVGARKIEYDLQITAYKDLSDKEWSVDVLAEAFKKHQDEQAEKNKGGAK